MLVGKYLLVYVLLPTLESYICSLDIHHHHSNNTYISNSIYDHVTSYLIYHRDLYTYHCILYLHTLCTIPISIDLVCFMYTFIILHFIYIFIYYICCCFLVVSILGILYLVFLLFAISKILNMLALLSL